MDTTPLTTPQTTGEAVDVLSPALDTMREAANVTPMDMFIRMVGCLAVIVSVSFLMTRYWLRRKEEGRSPGWPALLAMGGIFGLVSIYGTMGGFVLRGLFLNMRDIGPLIGGLYFGPVVGLVAAVVGAGHRLLVGVVGGTWLNADDSTIPCVIGTLLAGLVGGFAGWRLRRRRGGEPGLRHALGLGLFMSLSHMLVVVVYDRAMGYRFFGDVWYFWISFYLLGMGCYALSAKYLAAERARELTAKIMESELGIARGIQQNILPNIFPAFPERREIDLYAYLAPAREVGGDFYDFFMLDERRLLLLIGDVSGKGIPAALFMAVTRTLLRSKDWRGKDIESVIGEVNNELALNNSETMFVTLYAAAVDLETGEIECVNAGHNPPMLRHVRADGAGGAQLEWLRRPVGLPLGAMAEIPFHRTTQRLGPGDLLLLYTDGLTEAERVDHAQFGEERLAQRLAAAPAGISAREVCDDLVKAAADFTEGAPPSDDLTLLCLRYRGES